ncbi:auxin-responsive protein SAUR72-like [Euphorbia lathyris]|uniref:auxin-responsive protein SAUR72-like n=1 Tax=Euphorbia lathyris TaxID=212925 RepID=UPI0033143F7F
MCTSFSSFIYFPSLPLFSSTSPFFFPFPLFSLSSLSPSFLSLKSPPLRTSEHGIEATASPHASSTPSLLALMKQLIRRLSRVADSSQYSLLRSDSQSQARRCSGSGSRSARRAESFRCLVKTARRAGCGKPVPEGHVPVYVGDEMERFIVSAELLNHPIFIGLLNKSAQEYGYDQKGVLRIPCHVVVFERVMEALRLGLESCDDDLDEILGSLISDDYL